MGPKSPKIPILGTWIGISSQICEKIQIAISSDLCIRLTWHLTGSCGQQERLRGWSRMVVKQFQDGGRTPFWKSLYHHISVKNNPIFMKFCTQQQILNWMNVTWSKMKKLHRTDSRVRQNVFLVLQCFHPHLSDFCSRPRLTQPYNCIIYPGVAKIYLVFFWKRLLYLLILLFLASGSIHLQFWVQIFRLSPLVILSCCFCRYKFTLLLYLLVKILYTSIISPTFIFNSLQF